METTLVTTQKDLWQLRKVRNNSKCPRGTFKRLQSRSNSQESINYQTSPQQVGHSSQDNYKCRQLLSTRELQPNNETKVCRTQTYNENLKHEQWETLEHQIETEEECTPETRQYFVKCSNDHQNVLLKNEILKFHQKARIKGYSVLSGQFCTNDVSHR